ncbi:MAG TPA: sugar phosphorylase, partial [Chloroflexi bacterium]|nr:sugar phosphorylase [Chloroflexota bacterium]
SFKLMVDAVLNHVSTQSEWFQGFLRGDEKYREYFITVDPSTDLSMVVRPRDLPLLTPVETSWGTQYVWTTFSRDQIDLNYHNPDVLLEMIDILLFYIEQGADIIRLDAIAYLWKEIGTTCIHLPQTHAVVQLFRAIVDEVAPGVLLITETNVPHAENISYFGDGTNEAHLVYQFPLPPLVAHAFMRGTARHLTEWAAGLEAPSEQTSFFNFTASHDGVGVRPLAGLLGEEELEALIEQTHASGGQVSYKLNPDGSKSPYELNVTYFDLLNPPGRGESLSLQVRRFLASQAIMLALAGMPGIYFHSLLGSRNYLEGVKKTGYPRTINREKLDVREVEAALADPRSLRHAVFTGYRSLLQKRIAEKAFHPNAEQRVLSLNEAVFSLLRVAPSGEEAIIALHNVSTTGQPITINLHELELTIPAGHLRDIVSGATWAVEQPASFAFELEPYQVAWLKVLP